MKLLRYGHVGHERPGVLDAGGGIRDLSGIVGDLAGAVLSPAGLAELARLDLALLPEVDPDSRLGVPVAGTRNFIGIGLNYADHAAETGAEIPKEPIVFLKSLNALAGPNDDIRLPPGSVKTDWEIELAIIIGTTASHVDETIALDHVAGYAICNDVSEREWQLERGGSWDKGKGFDGFGPVGPWLVTPDEVADPQDLAMSLTVDGAVMQSGSTRTMIVGVREIVSYVSRVITLHPGDVITTGTPPGVGLAHSPPIFLSAGQTIQLSIAGLGQQTQRII